MAIPKLIFDTDPGLDDVLALLLLLASPEVKLEAITITFGNTSLLRARDNVLKVAQLIDSHIVANPNDASHFSNVNNDEPIILAEGATGPLEGSLDLAEYFHGPDGLSNISETHPQFDLDSDRKPSVWLRGTDKRAHRLILEILEREPINTVVVVAVGPLTNIALALRDSPETLARARNIVCMGGALDVPGNTSPVAEFNFFADPFAACEVLQAATASIVSFVLVPLDVTSRYAVPFSRLIHTVEAGASPTLHAFLSTILTRPRAVLQALGYLADCFEMHDPFAAWYAVCHAINADSNVEDKGWTLVHREFSLERRGEWTKGMCVVDKRAGKNETSGTIRSHDGIAVERNKSQSGVYSQTLNVLVLQDGPDLQVFESILTSRVFRYTE